MDVVVTPTGSKGTSWRLNDRLDRPLGAIDQDQEEVFKITPAAGGLISIQRTHPTLNDAMTAIANHLHGECTLDSQDWG
ncbi:hypothetical protein MKL09_09365 [Methylobacterium sp. J-048]|uniref:hypothetical protein n=1 Tax=unclassified Methylobacterium TaxID=2615210 RepID=UPI001FB86560|nr:MULTISPECIES: hypothetical protein [unclassified Methylobacterium]MCJ2056763.1 hypothetical protein [Methylobacterium sp. J-048]MCJ2141529.1 hypothetical protein [Methylobacterium sp. E-066]